MGQWDVAEHHVDPPVQTASRYGRRPAVRDTAVGQQQANTTWAAGRSDDGVRLTAPVVGETLFTRHGAPAGQSRSVTTGRELVDKCISDLAHPSAPSIIAHAERELRAGDRDHPWKDAAFCGVAPHHAQTPDSGRDGHRARSAGGAVNGSVVATLRQNGWSVRLGGGNPFLGTTAGSLRRRRDREGRVGRGDRPFTGVGDHNRSCEGVESPRAGAVAPSFLPVAGIRPRAVRTYACRVTGHRLT